tara:strand:- start:421 stop:582 length:162 start_codon:yes stop_codon:yes gene_type:complete
VIRAERSSALPSSASVFERALAPLAKETWRFDSPNGFGGIGDDSFVGCAIGWR